MTHPSIFTLDRDAAHPSDGVDTATLQDQRKTEYTIHRDLLPRATVPGSDSSSDSSSSTTLKKNAHTQWLAGSFFRLPKGYTSLDASKPWLLYWTIHSADMLGSAFDPLMKERIVSNIMHCLSPSGGFAGGAANTQIPHLLPSYASVCALAIAGDDGPSGGWKQLAEARQGMYDFFMSCKRPDGGFSVCAGGELDVRGTYCLLVVASLLDLLTPELLHNVDKFLAACQTYEGGFACSAYSFEGGRAALAEAHGGYTSCAVLSHFMLQSVAGSGLESLGEFPAPIDVKSALRWSAMMQGEAWEAGGFRGRSNKLVDGCYSWWVGGTVPVLEEMARREGERKREGKGKGEVEDGDEWVDETSPCLFNRVALQEYILLAAQRPGVIEEGGERLGGLRDKPGKHPDLYHTCNNLAGLSVAQHHMRHALSDVLGKFDKSKGLPPVKTGEGGDWKSEEERQQARANAWAGLLAWAEESELVVGGEESRVNATMPVVNILGERLKPFVDYFYAQ